jgi:thiol-disulfide isomerase/thioredoxin
MRNLKMFGALLCLVAIFGVVALFARRSAAENAANSTGKPAVAPSWELQNVDGQTVRFADFKGKVVILDFWATWCPPCRAEIPGLIELQKQYGKQGLAVVGVSLDQDGAADVKAFAQKFGINYPVVLADQKVVQAYGEIEAIPTTFVVDRAGGIVAKHIGFTDKGDFEKEIKPLLKP